jgi:hypothetical protein
MDAVPAGRMDDAGLEVEEKMTLLRRSPAQTLS